jgi:hypothetical protein
MYDNIDFKLKNTEAANVDFLNETSKYFDVTGQHNFENGFVLSGTLGGDFKILVNRDSVSIKGGSLCKYYLDDNFKTLGRGATQKAIEKLSDTMHLPFEKATITRLDIAQNFIVQEPCQNYYNHLGEWHDGNKKSTRASIIENGKLETLYYYQSNGLLLFYDKVKEQKIKGQLIPELYQNKNVLRYEQRYKGRLSKCFNVERVTGAMLFDEAFYINVINLWKENYFNIKKINDISLNFEAMKGKTDLYNAGILALVEQCGGELNFLSQIQEAQKAGKLSRKQAFDMRQVVTAACKIKHGITAQNEAIMELDKKIIEAVKYYR